MMIRWWSLAFAIAMTFLIAFLMFSEIDTSAMMRTATPLAAVIGVALLIADVFLPVPSSLVMVAMGALFGVAGGTALSLAGSVASALTAFAVGRAGNGVVRRLVTAREHERAGALLEKWGVVAIAVSRPVPILAETVALLAGSSPLTWRETTIAATAGSLLPAVAYAWAGAHALGTGNQAIIFGGVIAITALLALLPKRHATR